ncbi:MAG TPA: class I lanthipeptide [Thermoanaerobaculia bacterium]
MKKQLKKLVLHRETLGSLNPVQLRAVPGLSGQSECGASQCVSYCVSDTFPGNCPHSWNGTCTNCTNCTETTLTA